MKKIIILLMLIPTIAFGYDLERDLNTLFKYVSQTQEITVDGSIYEVDMRRLLVMTMGIESNFGKDKYHGRVAKSPMQFELSTAEHYVKIIPELRQYLESKIGRKLTFKDRDCIYISYLIYMSKLQHHHKWLTRHKRYFIETGDIEWLVYKVLWNSIKGASTYKKWTYRYGLYYKGGYYEV